MRLEEIKDEIINKLKPLNPEKIIIFGSFAYGEVTKDSDIDICVVEKEVKSKIAEKKKIREALKNIKIAKDILVPSLQEYEFYKNEINSVYNDIDTKGILLWQNS